MVVDIIALVLVIIGALNWLLVGLFQFDLVAWIAAVKQPRWRALYIALSVLQAFGAYPSCSASARLTIKQST